VDRLETKAFSKSDMRPSLARPEQNHLADRVRSAVYVCRVDIATKRRVYDTIATRAQQRQPINHGLTRGSVIGPMLATTRAFPGERCYAVDNGTKKSQTMFAMGAAKESLP